MTTGTEKLHEIVATPLADLGLELVRRRARRRAAAGHGRAPDGTSIDIDAIAAATRIVSRELDEPRSDPGRYTLEVSSPGLERPLRTPAHFLRAVGQRGRGQARSRASRATAGSRGLLTAADDDGIVVTSTSNDGPVTRRLAYDEIERARTVFEWGAAAEGAQAKRVDAKGTRGASQTAAKEAAR